MIDHYSFGNIVINGQTYNSDVIIYPDQVDSSWWRDQGHSLVPQDITRVIQRKPDILIIGCGSSGLLTIPESTRAYVQEQGIKLIDRPTEEACQEYNRLLKAKANIIAALHLTC